MALREWVWIDIVTKGCLTEFWKFQDFLKLRQITGDQYLGDAILLVG
jgi:hypothetical protein